MINMDPVMSGEGGRMVKAFSTLGAPVWLFNRQNALFWEGVVGESLPRGDGGVLLGWRLLLLWLRRLLFVLQMNSLVSREGGGVIESFATVRTGVTLSLGVDSLVPGQGRGMIETLITVVAHVGLVTLLVDPLLRGGAKGHGFPRLRRWVHRVLQVDLVVAREGRGVIEALVTLSAGVGLPSSVDLLMLL